MSRYPDKEMLKSWGSFDTTVKLCKNAYSQQTVKRYENLLKTLETTYYKFDEDWRLYKDDTIKKTCKTEDAFNGYSDDGVPIFQHNDKWAENQLAVYIDTQELLQEILDQQATGGGSENTSKHGVDAEFAVSVIKADMKSLGESIEKLKLEIEGHEITWYQSVQLWVMII